jgi:hypothetical protein
MAAACRAQFAAVLTVAAVMSAPFAHAEPSDSGSGSTGSAGSARSASDNDSSPKAPTKAATEAKKWQDLENNTAKQADVLSKVQAEAVANRIAQIHVASQQQRDDLSRQLDLDYQAQADAVTQQENDMVGAVQDEATTLQQLSSAQSALAVEMSDAADEAAVLAALDANDTAALSAQLEQSAKDRRGMLADKKSLANTLADQTQGNLAVQQGIGQVMNGIGAMEGVQQYNADMTREIVEAQQAQAGDPVVKAELVQQMMNLQQEVRDQLAAIQGQQTEAMRAIAKNI